MPRDYTKQLKYKPEYCEMLIEHMAKGHSFESFGGVVLCGVRTLYDWAERFPEFAEAKAIAQMCGLLDIEKDLYGKRKGKGKGDTNAIMFALRTRYHKIYGEKMQQKVDVTAFNFVGDDD